MQKVYVITGGSSGIGLAIAKLAFSQGHIVYTFSRTPAKDENIKHVFCDVSQRDVVKNAFDEVLKNEGRIDCVINNAGIGIGGPAELEPSEDIDKIIKINFAGAINVATICIPYLRATHGTLINVGSAGGEFSLPFQAFYSATKSGLQSFSVALKNELRPLGVKVACALPGDAKTSFTKNRLKVDEKDEIYGERVQRSIEKMEKDEQNGMTAEKVAKDIFKLSKRKNPPATCTIGFSYKFLRFIKRLLPERLVVWILYRMYGK